MPGTTGYWVGAVVLVVGVVGGGLLIASSFGGLFTVPQPLERAGATVQAEARDAWAIYRVGGSLSDGAPDCEVVGPGGGALTVVQPLFAAPVTINEVAYVPVGSFTPGTSGPHQVRCAEAEFADGRLALGPQVGVGSIFGTVGGVFLGIGLGFVGLVIGIVLIVVTAVRRSAARRGPPPPPRWVPVPGYGPPPYAGGPPPPGAPGGDPFRR